MVSAILFMVTSILLVKHYPTNFLGTGSADVMQGSVVDKVAVPAVDSSTATESPATSSDVSTTASAVVVPPSQSNGETAAPQAAVAPVVDGKAASTSEEKK